MKRAWLVIATVLMFAVMVCAQAKTEKSTTSKGGKYTSAQTTKSAAKSDTAAKSADKARARKNSRSCPASAR